MREAGVARQPVREGGLVGTLFLPATPPARGVVLALGGAGGGLSEGAAESFASEGFAALALAYFGLDRLPRELVEIPLEYFGRALRWLRSRPWSGAGRVAVVGNSKGGELALLLAAAYPEHIRAVVGYAPSGIVWQGIPLDREFHHGGPRSPWTLRERPVPFVALARPLASEMVRITEHFLYDRPVSTRVFYDRALQDQTAVAAAGIPVEKIEGPVLLISGTDDRLWPSTRLSEMVVRRLEDHDHPYPHEHLRYDGAGHMISPPGYEPRASWARRLELGGGREANGFANADSWTKVLAFLRRSLSEETLG